MINESPKEALRDHYDLAKEIVIETVRQRHDLAAASHRIAESRYEIGYASQARDLMADVADAFRAKGFDMHSQQTTGYRLPIVNACVIYTWRMPQRSNAVRNFASSTARRAVFDTPPPELTLFDSSTQCEPTDERDTEQITEAVKDSLNRKLAVLLVMTRSTSKSLQQISWGLASLNNEGAVQVPNEEVLWQAEPATADQSKGQDVRAFDAGLPSKPVVERKSKRKSGTNDQ